MFLLLAGCGPLSSQAEVDSGDTEGEGLTVDGASDGQMLRGAGLIVSVTSDSQDDFDGASWLLPDPMANREMSDAVAHAPVALLDVVGDITGDGIDEWIGTDYEDVWVLSGAAHGTLSRAEATLVLEGFYAATGSPDLDGDAVPDLVSTGFGENGYIFSGASIGALAESDAVATITTPAAFGLLGTASGVGDLNGDGVAELVFGYQFSSDRVLDLRRLDGPIQDTIAADDAQLLEPPAHATFLWGVASGGDLDGDGRDEAVAMETTPSLFESGVVVYGDSLVPSGVVLVDDMALLGPGMSGDVDGDGRSDLVFYTHFDAKADGVWVVHGPVAGTVLIADVGTFYPTESNVWSGAAGDVDEDGVDDLVVGQSVPDGDAVVRITLGPR